MIERKEIRPNRFVEGIDIYNPSVSLDKIDYSGSLTPLKLDWNEATIPPAPEVKQALSAIIKRNNTLNWYPELFSKSLVRALADYTGRREDEIVVTNGSDDGLVLILRTFLEPGDHVVIPHPTYTHFLTQAETVGALISKPVTRTPFQPDSSVIINNTTADTKLVYIVNPNNPTGTLLPVKEIERLLKRYPNTIFLIDEAYYEFAGETATGLVSLYPNIIISRTFSKAFAMAGLRVGYIVANTAVITLLKRLLNPKSVNIFAQTAAIAALKYRHYTESYVQAVHQSKELFISFLRSRNITVFDSRANFVMVEHPHHKQLLAQLEQHNVFTRDRSNFAGMEHFFRITLGTIDQTKELIRRFEMILNSEK